MIDLRSDWVTRPTERMWAAMRSADESALAELQQRAAELLGKEDALWTPTCSAANLVALLTLCEAGDRVALEADAHILTTEGMGIEHLAHLQPVALGAADGAALVCLENTHTRAGGTVLSVDDVRRLVPPRTRLHVDGARLPNAAAALGVPLADLAEPADTVALSLNKGLGAPAGAVLAGPTEALGEAREHLRRVGGASVHQAYLLAAAGLVALDRVEAVADDNRRAAELAERLAAIDGVTVGAPETNLIFFAVAGRDARTLIEQLEARGVRGYERDERRVRFVTHAGVDDAAVERAATTVAAVVAR